MPNTFRETQSDQKVPKPDRFEGSDQEGWVMTGQDGRLGYDAITDNVETLEELQAIRNPRPVKGY